jgi:hypothetical protein
MVTLKQWVMYVIRWECSTLILAPVMWYLTGLNPWIVAAIANFIGANVFIGVDEWIFKKNSPVKGERKDSCSCHC